MSLEQDLRSGRRHLVVLVDVELYDAAGALTGTHRLGLGHHAPSRADLAPAAQYLDRMTAGRAGVETLTELGRGGAQVSGELRFANRDRRLAPVAAAVEASARAEVLLRLGAAGLALTDFRSLGRYAVAAVAGGDEGDELVIELAGLESDLRAAPILIERYRGYGQAVDMAAVFPDPPNHLEVTNDTTIIPATGLSMGLAIYNRSAIHDDYWLMRLTTAAGVMVAALDVAETTETLRVTIRDAGGTSRVLDAGDLVVPRDRWAYAEMRWDATTGLIQAMLDGVLSATTATAATITTGDGPLLVADPLATHGIAGYVTEIRLSANPPAVEVLQARARRALPPETWGEYDLYLATGPVPGAPTDRLYDSSPNDLEVVAGQVLAFVDSATGTAARAGEAIPTVFGQRYLTGVALSEDLRRVGFGLGPIRGWGGLRTGDRAVWLKLTLEVEGTWNTFGFIADAGQPVLTSLQPGQWLRGTKGATQRTSQVQTATTTEISFAPATRVASGGSGTWTLETVAPLAPSLTGVTFHAPSEIRGAPGQFRHRRAGQALTINGTALNNGVYQLAADVLPPYDRLFVVETTIVDETPGGQVTTTFGEPYDAVADLELGHVVMVVGAGVAVEGYVYGVGGETAPGVFEALATHGGLRGAADLGASIAAASDPYPMGLAVTEETTIGEALDRVAASLDATWLEHPETGLLELLPLAAPAAEDATAREIARAAGLRTWPAFDGLAVEYQLGSVDVGAGARRADLPRVSTLYATAEGARARGEAMLALRSVARRGAEIEVPIWAWTWDLLAATLRTAGDPQAVDTLWRVLAAAWELSATLRLTLWR